MPLKCVKSSIFGISWTHRIVPGLVDVQFSQRGTGDLSRDGQLIGQNTLVIPGCFGWRYHHDHRLRHSEERQLPHRGL